MRLFRSSCIDEKTHYEMVLSDASFNQAVDWLQRELDKHDKEIYRHEVDLNGLHHLWTGKFKSGQYVNVVKFFYDEDRGYLMHE